MNEQGLQTWGTLKEWVFAVLCVVVLFLIVVPFVSRGGGYSREAARRSVCMNNIRNLALAAMHYESVHGELPMGVGVNDQDGVLQANPLSGVIALLPYLEQQTLYSEIANPMATDGNKYPAFEASLLDSEYPPWQREIKLLVCPASASDSSEFARTSYAFSIGDVARDISQQEILRGAFGYFKALDTGDVEDGLSNTIGMVEIGGGSINKVTSGCLANGKASWLDNPRHVFTMTDKWNYSSGTKLIDRGSHWADGRAGVGLASTILPPNSPSFQVQGSPTADGIYSAGSKHPGGVNVAHLDGSVHFVSEDIDTGDGAATLTDAGEPTPHGVWGAAGTINGGEVSSIYE